MAADKVAAFSNGARYVPAGDWARFFTWLIDLLVFAFGVTAGIVALVLIDQSRDLGDGVLALGMLAVLFAVPLLYGLCYTDGRALGGLMAGTRLVRLSDGGRIGAKGPWAMLVRTVLLPLLIFWLIAGDGYANGTFKRGSIDVARTRRLHEQSDRMPRPAAR